MAQTREGALKIAAKKAGTTVHWYLRRMNAGKKWCSLCRDWHDQSAFNKDNSRWDGLYPSCAESVRKRARDKYVSRPRQRGRRFVKERPEDRVQARGRVNYLVRAGLLENPNALPCVDCRHIRKGKGDRRHEYDHYLGYAAEHHETVEPVCTKCHHRRARERGEI